jgi:hypothetical protein
LREKKIPPMFYFDNPKQLRQLGIGLNDKKISSDIMDV